MAENGEMRSSHPVPDPTVLTTEALQREVGALKELIELRIEGLKDLVERQFELVERQRVEQKLDTKGAVDAALIAQKEAVKEQTTASDRAIAKSETATNKQLEQTANTFTTAIVGVTDTLSDIKTRLERIENAKTERSESRTLGFSLVGAAVAIVSVVIVLANLLTK